MWNGELIVEYYRNVFENSICRIFQRARETFILTKVCLRHVNAPAVSLSHKWPDMCTNCTSNFTCFIFSVYKEYFHSGIIISSTKIIIAYLYASDFHRHFYEIRFFFSHFFSDHTASSSFTYYDNIITTLLLQCSLYCICTCFIYAYNAIITFYSLVSSFT